MPKIKAATVKEHRHMILERLIDSAEELLRENPGGQVTAQTVAQAAGVARNSIYRYVDSVNDLVALVIGRHLPRWLDAVNDRLEGVEDPAERICLWVRANLEQAAQSSHTWMMSVANSPTLGEYTLREVESFHQEFRLSLAEEWRRLGSATPGLHAAITRSILEAGFRGIDGANDSSTVIRPPAPVCPLEARHKDEMAQTVSTSVVIETTVDCVRALVAAVRSGGCPAHGDFRPKDSGC